MFAPGRARPRSSHSGLRGASRGRRRRDDDRGHPARRQGLEACRRIADDREHTLRYWTRDWGAATVRPQDLGAAYAATIFSGFDSSIRAAAGDGCADGIRTVEQPIRFVLDGRLSVGHTVEVSITNV